jgi:hypothetical protein
MKFKEEAAKTQEKAIAKRTDEQKIKLIVNVIVRYYDCHCLLFLLFWYCFVGLFLLSFWCFVVIVCDCDVFFVL